MARKTKQIDSAIDSSQSVTETVMSTERVYQPTDTILCRSVTQGKLFFKGIKTGTKYVFAGYDDVALVEYQDLQSLLLSRSGFLLMPYFVIEDDELIEQPRWSAIKKLYEKMYREHTIDDWLALSNKAFEKKLTEAPAGLKNSIKVEVSNRVENGTLDSLAKIKIVEKVCNCEILVSGD